VTYNGVTYISGGYGTTYNYNNNNPPIVNNGTGPVSYGGGGSGSSTNGSNQYFGGYAGYQGVCIITYLNTQ